MIPQHQKIVCNSRHWSSMAWLEQHQPQASIAYRPGIRANEIDQDTTLITTYPLHLAARAGSLVNIEYGISPRQAELTPKQMDEHEAHLVHYKLIASQDPNIPETYPAFVVWLSNQPIESRLAILADLVRRFG